MPSGNSEALREACALGDIDGVASILQSGKVDVNDRHAINGWTALHWATKRCHATIVDLLMKYGADPTVVNFKEETPVALCTSDDIAILLGSSVKIDSSKEISAKETSPAFVPNYIRHPPFPYVNKEANNNVRETADIQSKLSSHLSAVSAENGRSVGNGSRLDLESSSRGLPNHLSSQQHLTQQQQHFLPPHLHHPTCQAFLPYPGYHPGIFVLKVRIADQMDSDFIEVEFPRFERDVLVDEGARRPTDQDRVSGAEKTSENAGASSTDLLTFESFIEILCDELRIPTPNLILKIRKLPDTIVRKGRDVHRLKDFQEIEVVLSKKPFSESSPLARPFESNGSTVMPPGYHSSGRRSSSSSAPAATTPVPPSVATILY